MRFPARGSEEEPADDYWRIGIPCRTGPDSAPTGGRVGFVGPLLAGTGYAAESASVPRAFAQMVRASSSVSSARSAMGRPRIRAA